MSYIRFRNIGTVNLFLLTGGGLLRPREEMYAEERVLNYPHIWKQVDAGLLQLVDPMLPSPLRFVDVTEEIHGG